MELKIVTLTDAELVLVNADKKEYQYKKTAINLLEMAKEQVIRARWMC
jgi:hypothetical protein